MDHVVTVILPLTVDILWGIIGYEATFFIGVAVATCLLITAQKIKFHS